MQVKRALKICIASLLCVLVPGASGYGREGHQIIGSLAQAFLTPAAEATVQALLPPRMHGRLSVAATWADEIKGRRRDLDWAKRLHYVNPGNDNPPTTCTRFVRERDCPNDDCIIGAIWNYTRRVDDLYTAIPQHVLEEEAATVTGLGGYRKRKHRKHHGDEDDDNKGGGGKKRKRKDHDKTPGDGPHDEDGHGALRERRHALYFLVHFMGDLHQPLHDSGKEKGGNGIKVLFDGKSVSLHYAWDSSLVKKRIAERFDGDQSKYVDYLSQMLNTTWQSHHTAWMTCPATSDGTLGQTHNTHYRALARLNTPTSSSCPYANFLCPSHWGRYMSHMNCATVWVYAEGEDLAGEYYDRHAPLLDLWLAMGGYRLATILNHVLPSGGSGTVSTDAAFCAGIDG